MESNAVYIVVIGLSVLAIGFILYYVFKNSETPEIPAAPFSSEPYPPETLKTRYTDSIVPDASGVAVPKDADLFDPVTQAKKNKYTPTYQDQQYGYNPNSVGSTTPTPKNTTDNSDDNVVAAVVVSELLTNPSTPEYIAPSYSGYQAEPPKMENHYQHVTPSVCSAPDTSPSYTSGGSNDSYGSYSAPSSSSNDSYGSYSSSDNSSSSSSSSDSCSSSGC